MTETPQETPEAPEPPQVTSAAFTALVIRVAAIRGSVGILETWTQDEFTKVRQEMQATPASGRGPAAMWWPGMSEQERAAATAALGTWVEEILRQWYPDYSRPLSECILSHPEALIELGNLAAEFARIYGNANPPLADAIALHDRWLPGVLKRLAVITDRCAPGMCSRQGR